MAYWLVKSEPDTWSWDQHVKKGNDAWTGVRNFTARNNMKEMALGDLAFFYHSNIGKEVVGIMEVIALAHPEAGDDSGVWKCVDVRAVEDVPQPVKLAEIKANPKLANMALVKYSRLSVQPVTADEWKIVCKMGGVTP